MVVRWLLPLFAAVAIFASSITTWAASGTIGEVTCCCPVPAKCKCHDHDEDPPAEKLRRCSGDAELVAPAVLAAEPTPAVALACELVVVVWPPCPAPILVDRPLAPPERPPS